MRFHLCKQSRMYSGFPYSGYTSEGMVGEAETLEEAIELARKFTEINPVGWDVYDSTTGQQVYGRFVDKE